MTPEQTEISRRLTDCKQWQWRGSMNGRYDHRKTDGNPHFTDPFRLGGAMEGRSANDMMRRHMPDLADYATAAILLVLAMRAAPGNDWLWSVFWFETPFEGETIPHGADLGTAAATALLAIWEAPKKT